METNNFVPQSPIAIPYLPRLSIPEAEAQSLMSTYHDGSTVSGSPSGSSSSQSLSDGGRHGHPRPHVEGEIGAQRNLAPLRSLQRRHPYSRDPIDDKALRMLEASLARSIPIQAAAAATTAT